MLEQKKNLFVFKMISFLLVIMLFIEALPVIAIGNMLQDHSTTEMESQVLQNDGEVLFNAEESNEEVYVLGEDNSLRTENEKHFRLSNGSYSVAAYEEAVHYLDESGIWQDIDNNFSESTEKEDGFSGVENKKNSVKVKFSNKSNANYLYRVKDGDYSIFVGVYKKGENLPNKVDAVIAQNSATETNDKAQKKNLEEVVELKNQTSKVTYFDLWDNIDLEYVLHGTSVKENIIVNEKADSYSYTFTLKLKNLIPILNEDKSISLKDSETGKEIYLIPAPYMYDNSGEMSKAVDYKIESTNGNGQYLLTVTADKEWIEDENRAFPVTVDPVLIKEGLAADVRDNYIKEGTPNAIIYNAADILYLGYDCSSSILNERVYTKYNSLPELPSSAIITQALLYYCQMPAYSPGYSGTNGLVVTAREVLGSWDSSTITWNNQPSYNSTILDYVTVGSNTNGTFLNWDITSTVQKWYDGTLANNGIVLMSDQNLSLAVDMNVRLASSDNANSTMVPRLVIAYRDSKGLEDYWTYESFNFSGIGTAYVNVFNRNLTFVYDLYETPGSVLPINFSAVYNSSLANVKGHSNNTVNNGTGSHLGYGTKFNLNEKIYETTISDRLYYVHEDADGTEHYYYDKDNNGTFVSEDGLDYTITSNGTSYKTYTMKNSDGIVKEFNSFGLLSYIQDKYGNKKRFTYNGTKLECVIEHAPGDSIGELLVVPYVSGGVVDNICGNDTESNKVKAGYTNERLTSLKYYSRVSGTETLVNTVQMTYDSNGRLSSVTSSINNEKIQFTYDSQSCISKITQSKNNAVENIVFATKYGDKTTRFQHWGKDAATNTADDTYTIYSCDNYGRVISSYVTDYTGNVLGSATTTYNNAEGTKKHNTVAESAVKNSTTENIISQPSFEEATNSNFFDTGAGYSYTTGETYTGNRSLKMELSGNSVSGSFLVNQVGTYCFSAYVKCINVTGTPSMYLSASGGAELENTRVYLPLGTTDTEIENGWKRIYFTAEIETTGFYRVYIDGSGTGTVYVDCIQLEKAKAPGKYNLASPSLFWTTKTNSNYGENSYPIKNAWQMQGDTTKGSSNISSFTRDIKINRPGTDTYTLSFWAMSNSVRTGTDPINESIERTFYVDYVIHYTDGTSSATKKHDINTQNRSKQFITIPVIPDSTKTVDYITIGCKYNNNANNSYVGDFSLTLEPAQSYTYDNEGNVKTVSTATGKSMLTYASNNLDLLKSVLPNGDEYTFTYANSAEGVKADVLSVTNKNNVKVSYEYDAYGNVTKTTASNTNGGTTYTNNYGYSENGNFLTSVTDSKGKTTTNTYNYNNGLLLSTLSPAGRTSYNYLNNGLLSQVIQDKDNDHVVDANEAFVEYAYNQNLLTQINKGNMKYAFLYNGFGQRTQVKIDGRTTPLATYTYSASGGYVTKMQYGNGDYIDYSYDNLGRLIAVSYNGVKTYEYIYNNNGDLYCTKDLENGITYISEYDNLGRLIRMRETTDGGERLFVENSFDQYGRATKTTYKYGSSSGYYGITYKQNSDLVEWLRLPNYSKIQYTYDHLERISGMTVMSNSENYTYAGSIYEYSSGNGSNTTSDTIDKVTLRMTNTQFSYVYDDCNNITEIYKNNSLIRKYSYDDLQQMTKEVIIEPGATTGTQYDYVYDLHGNILSKTESTYTVATGATSGSTTTQYTYGDNTWGDLLTSYGDLTFTYDEIGNLVSRHREGISSAYYFNWGKGRQLESLSYGTSAESATTVVEHEYNSDGVRISRTFNAGGLEYIVDGDRILKQVGCGIGVLQTLEFYYDAQGEIIGFNYDGRKGINFYDFDPLPKTIHRYTHYGK